MLKLGCCFPQP